MSIDLVKENHFAEETSEYNLKKDNDMTKEASEKYDNGSPFSDIDYIRASTSLITSSLQKGFDIAQLPNGDIIVTEVKIVNSHHIYDHEKQKMVRTSQS
ncbi:MAG: DUF2671 domain-containing protein [Janthinobacterium lividum]